MERKEYTVTRTESRSINIAGGKAESLRLNSETQNTVRIYSGGKIGVAGKIGETDFSALEKEAESNLSNRIVYPDEPSARQVISFDCRKKLPEAAQFVPAVKNLIERINKENPNFIFSNKIQQNEVYTRYECGSAKLEYRGNAMQFGLVIKDKKSANIMDEIYGAYGDSYDEELISGDIKRLCDAFLNPMPHINGDDAVVICGVDSIMPFLRHFSADAYASGTSLLSEKLGKTIFSEKFGLMFDRSPQSAINIPFFDAEGVVNDGYKAYLAKDGILKGLLTTKKTAKQHSLNNIGNAGAAYNGVPSVSLEGLDAIKTNNSIDEILQGREAVYVSVTSGGDMTPDGILSLPVQSSYIYKDGKLIGKLPGFTLTANIFDALGKDYLGAARNIFGYGTGNNMVFKMKMVNKD